MKSIVDFTNEIKAYFATKQALTSVKDSVSSIDIVGSTNNTGTTIALGTYFYLNGTLVRAKTAIANGTTLTLNTNYEVVTAGGLNDIVNKNKVIVYDYQTLTKENAITAFINDGHVVAGERVSATLRTSDAYYNCDFIRGGSTTTGWGVNLTNASDRFTFKKPANDTLSLSTF